MSPPKYNEDASCQPEAARWLRRSERIAMEMLDRMAFLGMSQRELSKKMGCTPQYISKILKGKENLSLETISKIEDALGIEFNYIPLVNPIHSTNLN